MSRLGPWDWVFSGAILVATVLMVRTVFVTGIGYDAAFEMQAYLTVSTIPSASTLQQAYDAAPITSEFYGMLTFQIASIIGRLFGVSLSPDQFSSYLVHHLVVSGLALAGAVAAGLGLGVALRSKTAGLFAAALILFTPLWLGMGAMNYKDIPVASGLSLLASALIVMGSSRQASWQLWVATWVAASFGAFMALGSRAGSVALIVFLMALTVLIRLLQGLYSRSFAAFGRTVGVSALALATAALGLFATNPFARINMYQWIQDSVTISREYIWVGVIRTAGQDLPSDQLPWWYAPAWLLAQLPVLTSFAIGAGIVVILAITFRGRVGHLSRRNIVDLSPLLLQGWVLPGVIIATGSVLYDGIRHLSFALPGIIAIGAVPIAALVARSRTARSVKLSWQRIVLASSVLVLAASAFAVVRWFPYSYAFINPIAGAQKEPRAWELDYWGLTAREGIVRLRAAGLDPIAVVPAAETGRPFSAVDGETANTTTVATGVPHGVYVFRRWDAVFRQDWCTRTFTIERDGQVLGEGGTCP